MYWDGYQNCVEVANRGSILILIAQKIITGKSTLKILKKTLNSNQNIKCFVLNSPSNPTGTLYSENYIIAITNVLKDFPNVKIISDEVYEYFIYDKNITKTLSISEIAPELSNRTIIINSLSKTYSLCGHRIGYYFGPKEIIEKINGYQLNHNIMSIDTQKNISEIIELEINKDPVIENSINKHVQFHKDNISEAYKILSKQNILKMNQPESGFFLWIDFSAILGMKTEEGIHLKEISDFYKYFIEKARIQIQPGDLFGDEKFSRYFRISCAGNHDQLINECKKITEIMNKLEKINQQSTSQTP